MDGFGEFCLWMVLFVVFVVFLCFGIDFLVGAVSNCLSVEVFFVSVTVGFLVFGVVGCAVFLRDSVLGGGVF